MAAKATRAKAAAEPTKKKKKAAPTRAAASARKPAKKPVTKKTAAGKPVAKKLVKKGAAKKPAVTKAKAPAKARKAATTVKARAPKGAAKVASRAPKARAAQARPAARARRAKPAVLEVSPAVIDTTSAAEVAARLVIDAHGPVPVAPSPMGNIFDPPPVVAVRRGSSALRHVKEKLNKPVARQLESVFGPAPLPAESMRRFLRNRDAGNQRVRGGTHVHVGPPTVPHRTVGNGGSRTGGRGGE